MKYVVALSFACIAFIGCAQTPPISAEPAAPTAAPAVVAAAPVSSESNASGAQLVSLGRSRYTLMCARCHGLNLASNGLGSDLRTFPQDAKERFTQSVNKGIRAMPAWETSLKPGELDAMWAYIGSVNGWLQK